MAARSIHPSLSTMEMLSMLGLIFLVMALMHLQSTHGLTANVRVTKFTNGVDLGQIHAWSDDELILSTPRRYLAGSITLLKRREYYTDSILKPIHWLRIAHGVPFMFELCCKGALIHLGSFHIRSNEHKLR